jgi:thiosulfate/3-mercaptopyruvate sulfurtransferase
MMSLTDPLVSTDWLAERLGADDIAVLDASWHMPAANRDPAAEFRDAHIAGALFFDIDGVADKSSGLPHMLPEPEVFAEAVSALGVGDETTVVAYDVGGFIASARLWWSLRAMGHDKVVVLDGGLAKWRAETRPIASGEAFARPKRFTPCGARSMEAPLQRSCSTPVRRRGSPAKRRSRALDWPAAICRAQSACPLAR